MRVATSAANDLAKFCGGQVAKLETVKFLYGGKGYVVDVKIEAHADGVCCDQIIDITILKKFNLRVAGARAETAKNHRSTATLTAYKLSDGVNILAGKSDNGGPSGQAGNLFRANIVEFRHAWTGDNIEAGDELFKNRSCR